MFAEDILAKQELVRCGAVMHPPHHLVAVAGGPKMLCSRGLHKQDTLCPAAAAAFSGRLSALALQIAAAPCVMVAATCCTPARSLVHDIIGKHSDLMAMFNEFLMRCEVGYWGDGQRV